MALRGQEQSAESGFGEVMIAGQGGHASTKMSAAINNLVDLSVAERATWPVKPELVQVQERVIRGESSGRSRVRGNQASHRLAGSRHGDELTFLNNRASHRVCHSFLCGEAVSSEYDRG